MSAQLIRLTATDLPDIPDPLGWARALPGPCLIDLPGEDNSRCRAMVTLLHGNEPSGLMAINAWLREQRHPPRTRLALIVANLDAALNEPAFTHRQSPGERDLNRCFRPPWDDRPGRLAQSIIATLVDLAPEAVIDMHNTSGRSPAFAVSILDDPRHRALAGLFSDHLVVTDLRLGALMDVAEHLFPTLTLECGGAHQPASHQVALHALARLAGEDNLFGQQPASGVPRVYHNPVRVELTDSARTRYGSEGAGLALREDIEDLNMTRVEPGETLAQLSHGLASLVARDHRGRSVLNELLTADKNCLTPKRPVYLFMATPNVAIARSDCLFYLAPAD